MNRSSLDNGESERKKHARGHVNNAYTNTHTHIMLSFALLHAKQQSKQRRHTFLRAETESCIACMESLKDLATKYFRLICQIFTLDMAVNSLLEFISLISAKGLIHSDF